ncbi:hypothetical protein [Pseudoalteromonas sp. P1-8]|uniref:hypothetical protein n=1 Tax=Pseudoalteromonas sp. P1-8 TaxID=1710353 RepID=UPI0006DCAEFB|nr:hypothetical protein [Pseudoalteromonas sp. P1-8]KPW03633.1 Transcriptional regulator VspR [Pseudoalteromonas sp. P1-8]
MSQIIKLNKLIYCLLIERSCDGFTIIELREELLALTNSFQDKYKARKFVYRQVTNLEQRELLKAKGSGRAKKYFKTELFNTTTVVAKSDEIKLENANSSSIDNQTSPFFEALSTEKKIVEAELAISLIEVDEYKALQERFPEHHRLIYSALDGAKNNSARLLGKVKALNNVLTSLENGVV